MVVKYWPDVIWQWVTIGGICSIIAAESPHSLIQKDQKNAWRVTHASVALRSSDREIDEEEVCMQIFYALKQRRCLDLYAATDSDGDTPLHSAVKTGDVKRVNILLDHLPLELLRGILETTNKLGQTPLKVSFDQEEWKILEMLLDYCIKYGLCSDLTGIGDNVQGSKTLLHHAMDKGCCRFVKMYFDVTKRNQGCGKPGLLVYDEDGRTPWFYLMNHKDSEILRNILFTLKEHNIDINDLITDRFSQSTMLHLAYRKQHLECIRLLIDAGADPGKKDMRDLRAYQRAHVIGGSRKKTHAHGLLIPHVHGEPENKVVQYWPDLILQWITTGSICSIIAAQSPHSLIQKDQKNAWSVTHASVALRSSDREIDEEEICMQIFHALKQRCRLDLYAETDRDGDTPLHSVVKTGDVKRLNILLDRLPRKLLGNILEMTNKLGQTPLKVAFDHEEWKILELLLSYCIKYGLCSNLTGVGDNVQGSKTLLHHAMDKGCCQFVEMYFDVIKRNQGYGKPDLLVCDEDGRTPWFYLMNHKDSEILRNILFTLKEHNIDINELITDRFSQSTMLHLAYRKQHQECIRLLTEAGANPEKKDMRDLRADQRDHVIGKAVQEETRHGIDQFPELHQFVGLQNTLSIPLSSDWYSLQSEVPSWESTNDMMLLCSWIRPFSSEYP